MDCNLINSDINACAVNAFKGYKRTGWFTMKSNIDEASVVISNATVKFGLKSGMFYEIYDDSVMPFNGSGVTVEVSSNHGYKFFNPTVKFPVKPFNPEYANVVSALAKGSELVVILEQEEKGTNDTSRYVVFGLQGGLVCTTPTFEMANDSVWEIELVEQRADNPALFLYDTDLAGTTALKTLLTEYEYISGLSLASGTVTPQQVSIITEGTSLRNHVILPDGSLLTSTTSTTKEVINTTWVGAAGSVIIIVPKSSTLVNLGSSGSPSVSAGKWVGALVVNGDYEVFSIPGCTGITSATFPYTTGYVYVSYCTALLTVTASLATLVSCEQSTNLTSIVAPYATHINAYNVKLTATAINNMLINANANISDFTDISFDFSSGTSAAYSTWSVTAQGIADAIDTAGGTVTYNT